MKSSTYPKRLEKFTHAFSKWAGTGKGFLAAILSVTIWIIIGGFFHYSNQWQNLLSIYINIITFLMIFLMQRSQNKELLALHVKLNELVAATKEADNQVINIEQLTEQEISDKHKTHQNISEKG